jgi:uncharacterized protein YidB (DUF937 family)
VANALKDIAKSIERGGVRSTMLSWVSNGKDGYWLRVNLPDDIYPIGTKIVKDKPSDH